MTNHSGVQAAIREQTGTALDYNGDWSALFDQDGIAAGAWNERLLAWINQYLGSSHADLPAAQQAFAVDQGYTNWSSMGTVVLGPTIQLSASTIAEDASINDVVGTLSVINGSGTYTFAITVDTDSKFQIANDDELQLSATVDYETATSHTVTIEADNGVDDVISRQFTVTVTDVAAPTITSTDTVSVNENATLSHTLTSNQTVTWSIVGGADQAQFEISTATLRWASNGTQNYEAPQDANTDNDYVVTVRATATATGETADQAITVTVDDVVAEFDDLTLGETFDSIYAPQAISKTWADAGNPTLQVEKGWASGTFQDLYPHTDGRLYTAAYGAGTEASSWAGGSVLFIEKIYNQAAADTATDVATKISDTTRCILDLTFTNAPRIAGYTSGADANLHATQRGYTIATTLQTNAYPYTMLAAVSAPSSGGSGDEYIVQDQTTGSTRVFIFDKSVVRQYVNWAIVIGKFKNVTIPHVIHATGIVDGHPIATGFQNRAGAGGVYQQGTAFAGSATEYTLRILGTTNALSGYCYGIMISKTTLTRSAMLSGGIPSLLGRTYANAIATDKPDIVYPFDTSTVAMNLSTEQADIPIILTGKPSTEYEADWNSSGYISIGTTDANGYLDGALTGRSKGNATLSVREVGGSTPCTVTNVAVGIVLAVFGESDPDGRNDYVPITVPTGFIRNRHVAEFLTYKVGAASPSAAGTGYTVNDVLTLSGGTGTAGTYTVTAVGGSGEVTTVEPRSAQLGAYTVVPSNPVTTTGGTGTGCTLTCEFGQYNIWWSLYLQYLYDTYGAVMDYVKITQGSTYFRNVADGGNWSTNIIAATAPNLQATSESALVQMQAELFTPNIVLMEIGKNDAARITSTAAFKTEITALVDKYQANVASGVKLATVSIGPNGSVIDTRTDNIRYGIQELWDEETSNYIPAGCFFHLPTTEAGGVQLKTTAEKQAAADILVRHIHGSGRGPKYSSAVVTGADIDITCTGGVSPLTIGASPTAGWAVTDNNGTRTVTGVTVSTLTITVTCDQALASPVTVTWGSGETAVSTTLLDSDATTPVPPEPFTATVTF